MNLANSATKRNIMSGFESVTRNAVTMLWISVPFCSGVGRSDFCGFERNV